MAFKLLTPSDPTEDKTLATDPQIVSLQGELDACEADLAGFPDELKYLTTAEIQQLENIGAETITAGQWTNLSQEAFTLPLYWNMITTPPDNIGQGTWVHSFNAAYVANALLFNSSNANGDNCSVNFRCPAGTYTLRLNQRTGSNYAITDVYIDGDEIASFDNYATSSAPLNMNVKTSIPLTAGAHTIKFQIDGRHASSSAWYMNLAGISLQRTS